MKENDTREARERMVERQLRKRGISDSHVLDAMLNIPRHIFVPDESKNLAYADAPLPIGHRQTISQPYIVALMSELLELRGTETVLEVGTGSGYQAAILAYLAKKVYSLERINELADEACRKLEACGIENVEVIVTDGSSGLPEHAPFEAMIVTAAAPNVPDPLLQQLRDGGRLVLPVGGQSGQILECWQRRGDRFNRKHIVPVSFVPLIGEFGWETDERPSSWLK